MDKRDLQKKLNQPYSTANWKEVVQFVFPNVQIFNPVQVIPIDVKHKNIVENFNHLGNVQLSDGKILSLLELKLKDKVNIIKNRVQLNEIVSSYIDTEISNGVLSIFEKGTDDYRFSFVARSYEFSDEGDLIENKTHAKRFTYVLGKNESCKTPALQFFELSNNKKTADINAIIKAFNITKLNKDFFDEYKDIYNNIVEFFTGKRLVKTSGKWEEKTTSKPDTQLTYIFKNNELDARNFTKMLLGRLVFLKFVQKKGWLGVSKERTDWKNGNIRFLEEAYENFKHKELFYSTFLSPLFFEALNNPNRKNDVFKLTDSKVPYLSGGLFDEDNLKTSEINIPKKHFDTIFDFLDRYNFTIDENVDIEDKNEFSIDPEMLGHIFENLLEDNKDKGAFYTPKEIVRYMCQESLKEYLKTSLENNKQWPTDETEAKDFEQALHNFVTKKEAGGVIEFEETIAQALKDVKICDPAIGSGAFPMGLLNEIFQLVHNLHEVSSDKLERIWGLKGWQPNLVKQNIIQNSIYGVDIEKGAVDVARLRFWLSLIVDEPEPKALPHLDYKIVVGNSLVSKLDDTIIDIDWQATAENLPETDLFGKAKPKQFNAFEVDNNEKQKQLLEQISIKQKAVFDPNSDEEKLSLEIRNLKIDLLSNQLDAMVKTKGVATEPKGIGKNLKAQTELWLQTLGWKNQINKLEKLKKDKNAPLHFFDWKLDFPEIMNDQVAEKVGFDIVIANPPYLSTKSISVNDKQNFINKFRTASGQFDLYGLFVEKGIQLLNENSLLTMITSSTYLNNKDFYPLRKIILDETKVLSISNLDETIFETAQVDVAILILKNKYVEKNNFKVYKDKISFLKKIYELTEQDEYRNESLLYEFKLNCTSVDFNLINKLFKNNSQLKDFLNLPRGIEVGSNSELIKTSFTKKTTKLLVGKDIKKYKINFNDRYIEFNDKDKSNFKDISIYNQEKILIQRIRNLTLKERLVACYDNDNLLCTNTLRIGILNQTHTSIKFLLGLINSTLINYIFLKFFLNKDIYAYQLEQIPIKKTESKKQKVISKIVDEVLKKKFQNIDTTDLEQQIDNLVYKLYDLTYDEVLVVEPAFSERMSKAAYESLKLE